MLALIQVPQHGLAILDKENRTGKDILKKDFYIMHSMCSDRVVPPTARLHKEMQMEYASLKSCCETMKCCVVNWAEGQS